MYRHQIFQENIRWKALDENYKIYIFLLRPQNFINISPNIIASLSDFFSTEENKNQICTDDHRCAVVLRASETYRCAVVCAYESSRAHYFLPRFCSEQVARRPKARVRTSVAPVKQCPSLVSRRCRPSVRLACSELPWAWEAWVACRSRRRCRLRLCRSRRPDKEAND